jgi:protein SCO1/2
MVMTLVRRFWIPIAAFFAVLTLLTAPLLVLSLWPTAPGPQRAAAGAPFRLATHDGGTLTSDDLKGRPVAIVFGFTHCPDVCPATLFEMSELLKELGPEADRLRVLFVTVDPERDTRQLLASYLESFDPRITGLTGSQAQIAVAARAYGVVYRKVPAEGGSYTLEHTAAVQLVDGRGELAAMLGYQEGRDAKLTKIRLLLRGT